jgi:hypothetical protein
VGRSSMTGMDGFGMSILGMGRGWGLRAALENPVSLMMGRGEEGGADTGMGVGRDVGTTVMLIWIIRGINEMGGGIGYEGRLGSYCRMWRRRRVVFAWMRYKLGIYGLPSRRGHQIYMRLNIGGTPRPMLFILCSGLSNIFR